jgi:hypothetical protein
VLALGFFAFAGCESLVEVSPPEGLTTIGHGTSWQGGSLRSIAIRSSMSQVGGKPFLPCGRSLT